MKGIFQDISNAFKKSNNQIVQMIIACVVIFALKLIADFTFSFFPNGNLYSTFLTQNIYLNSDPNQVLHHLAAILTFPFTTGGFIDLLFNVIAFYWIGNLLKEFIGGQKTTIIYIFGTYFSAFYFYLIYGIVATLTNKTPNIEFIMGFSPGIYAVLFAIVALLPHYEVSFFGIIFKFKYVALAFLIMSFYMPPIGVINMGGAIFGYLHIKFLRTGWNFTQPAENLLDWLNTKKTVRTQEKIKTFSKSTSSSGVLKKVNFEKESEFSSVQDEIDFLLDKISSKGYESLTAEEKLRLYKASQKKD